LIVVDASLFVAWVLNEPGHGPADQILDLLASDTLFVPSRWPDDVASALFKAVKNGKITMPELDAIEERIVTFSYAMAEPTAVHSMAALARLASEAGLSVYDMTYLIVASDHGLPLATVDHAMRRAAVALNVSLLPAATA
jgi:predicted nucleic acid-binding protein